MRSTTVISLAAVLVAGGGCMSVDTESPGAGTDAGLGAGGGAGADAGTGDAGCDGGDCALACLDSNAVIFAIDESNELLRFDPRKLGSAEDPFSVIATLSCPGTSASPLSMAVDRHGSAWVLYSDSKLFQVNTTTGACSVTNFSPRGAFQLFSMASVVTDRDAGVDPMYVVSRSAPPATTASIGVLSTTTFQVQSLGAVTVGDTSPELASTQDRLFAVFPGNTAAPVEQWDLQTGAALSDGGVFDGGIGADAVSWAFAHWGGDLYLFVGTSDALRLQRMDLVTHAVDSVPVSSTYRLIAASSSPCAPTH